jgi:hypothetical protein
MFQIIVEGQEIKRKMARGTEMREMDISTHGVDTNTAPRGTPLSTATVIELRLTREDLSSVDEGNETDRDVIFLRENTDNDPNGFVVYKGTPQLTQTALYLMLFQDNVERWIQEESVVGPLNTVSPSAVSPQRNVSVYEDNDEYQTES